MKGYVLNLKEDDPEFKTIKLLFGKLLFRKKRDKWQYGEGKLLEFAKENIKSPVTVKVKVDKRKLKKHLKKSGDKAVIKKSYPATIIL